MPSSRVRFVWLWVMELAAVTVAALLYVFKAIPEAYFFIVLISAVVGTGALFFAVYLIAERRQSPGRPQAKFELTRADEIDAKVEEYMRLGRQMLGQERYDEAAKMFQEVLARNARSWQAHNYLGRAYSCLGRFEEAKDAYERAVSLEFNYASAHFNLATAHEKLGEFGKALDRWRQYIEVGLTIGERDDMLDHARQRINTIEENLRKNGSRDADAGERNVDF